MKRLFLFSLLLLLALSACGGVSGNATPTGEAACDPAIPCVDGTPAALATPTTVGPVFSSPEPVDAPTPVSTSVAANDVSETADPPACTSPARLTPSSTEGPYYMPNPPENSSLAGDLPGTRLLLTGFVLDENCQPISGARVDFWQADSQGVYDNAGYTLRGYQTTGEDGSYRLETVIPGQYPGRTEHIHVKVQAPGGPELTSQLYFPESTTNSGDGIFLPQLLVKIVSEDGQQVSARFDFVVKR